MAASPWIDLVATSAPPTIVGSLARAHCTLLRALPRRDYPAQVFTFEDQVLEKHENNVHRGCPRTLRDLKAHAQIATSLGYAWPQTACVYLEFPRFL